MGALTISACATSNGPPPGLLENADYGPPPTEAEFFRVAEEEIRNSLIDPDSGRFDWPNPIVRGYWPETGYSRAGYFGYFTCGRINARNRMGGYTGRKPFAVVYRYGRILYSNIADSTYGDIAMLCASTQWEQNFSWTEEAETQSDPALKPTNDITGQD